MMKFRFVGIALALTLVVGLACSEAGAEERIPLIDATDADAVWSFNHGAEFPGATGSLSIDPEAERQGNASLKLVGDFTQGGGYVQAGRQLGDGIDIRELSFWVKSPGTDRFTLRLGDASGQTHQIVLKTEPGEEWQRVVLPLERFFERRGQADAVTGIAKYESWGGAKDGNWHGPAKAIYLLLSNGGANQVRTLWLNEVVITPKPMPVPGAEMRTEVSLEEFPDWKFSLGQEFPGAKGSLTEVESEERSDLKLSGDFTGGGAYVAAIRNLADLGAAEVPALHLRYRSANAKSVTIQLVDGGGQTHQRRGFSITGDGEWHDLTLKPAEFAGGDRWGGANDGQWHGVIRQLVISLTADSDKENKRPEIQLAKVRAEVVQPVFAQPAAFTSDFETAALGDEWVVSGDVKIEAGALRLSRTLDAVEQACSVTGPAFPASPGQWEVSLVTQADLKSPDNSYNAVVQLECLDSAGKIVERFTLVDGFGQRDRETVRKLIELPKGVVAARFQAQLNKAHGEFLIDDLAAAYLAPAPQRDDRISRVLFSTAQLGNLLFPDDSREVGVTIEARKPLRDDQKSLSWVVRDYWGAEQNQPVTMMLGEPEKKKDTLVYETSIDLSGVPLEIGRYYELHATIPLGENAEPFRNHTSLAILPEAVTRQYPPEEIPFTSRNWDNRISEYIRL
ncbi:MAG: hypothetical protein KDN20_22025, partial [Verrucomicrobiae bacterium]|nr:hypothetical protein [Verrucomicrobiae bacterium]